jgi:hypothetical protein
MKKLLFILSLAMSLTVYCQQNDKRLFGRYIDNISSLTLNADSTFELRTPDPVFSYTFEYYSNTGVWTIDGNVITLNPGKKKRLPQVSLIEKEIEGEDSIQVKINYLLEEYAMDSVLFKKRPFEFDMITLYVNKTFRTIVHERKVRVCGFAPRVKKQAILDSSGIIKLPKQKIERLAVFSYGFDNDIELHPVNPNANYYEITIVHPVDCDRRPRSKKVIMKGKNAYYYEWRGKVRTSLIPLTRAQ